MTRAMKRLLLPIYFLRRNSRGQYVLMAAIDRQRRPGECPIDQDLNLRSRPRRCDFEPCQAVRPGNRAQVQASQNAGRCRRRERNAAMLDHPASAKLDLLDKIDRSRTVDSGATGNLQLPASGHHSSIRIVKTPACRIERASCVFLVEDGGTAFCERCLGKIE